MDKESVGKDMTKGTVIRTALLLLAVINGVLGLFGKSPLSVTDEFVEQTITLAFLVGTGAAAWWKNNSFTEAAQIADKTLKDEKNKPKG